MNDLLPRIIETHGGMDYWNSFDKVEVTIVSGGGLFSLKGRPQDSAPRRMTAWLHEERTSISPYGASDQRAVFTPKRILSMAELLRSVVRRRILSRASK